MPVSSPYVLRFLTQTDLKRGFVRKANTGYIRKPPKLHFSGRILGVPPCVSGLGVVYNEGERRNTHSLPNTGEQYYGKVGVPILKGLQDRLMWRRALGTYDELAFFQPLDQASAAALYAWFSWIRGFLPFLNRRIIQVMVDLGRPF